MYKDLNVGMLVFAFIIGYIIVSFVIARWFQSKSSQGRQYTGHQSNDRKKSGESDEGYRWRERNKWQEEQTGSDYSSSESAKFKDEAYYARILGLKGKITYAEVRNKYKELVLQYHPDKVNHLGPKLQQFAEQEMKEINEAFQYFKRHYG